MFLRTLLLLLVAAAWSSSTRASSYNPSSTLRVRPDGGYEGLVVRVEEDVPESQCKDVIRNIKVGCVSY